MNRMVLALAIFFGLTSTASALPPTYTLQLKANPAKCLQKKDPGWDNGNPIHLWDCGIDKDNESWQNTIFRGTKAQTNTYQNSLTALNRAKNYARQAAEERNGGLQKYRAEDKMHGPVANTGLVENPDGTVTFTFYGGRPTAEPTIESVVTVEINGWTTRIDYNGPIRH